MLRPQSISGFYEGNAEQGPRDLAPSLDRCLLSYGPGLWHLTYPGLVYLIS